MQKNRTLEVTKKINGTTTTSNRLNVNTNNEITPTRSRRPRRIKSKETSCKVLKTL